MNGNSRTSLLNGQIIDYEIRDFFMMREIFPACKTIFTYGKMQNVSLMHTEKSLHISIG